MSRSYRSNKTKKITENTEDVKPVKEDKDEKKFKKDSHKPTSQTFNIFMSSYNFEVFNKAKETFFPIVKALGDNRVENKVLEELIDNWKNRVIEVNNAYIEYNKKTKSSTVKE